MFPHSTYILWAVITVCKLLLFILSARSTYRWFTLYMGATFAKSAGLWVVALTGNESAYVRIYHLGGIVEHAALFVVILSIGAQLFWPLDIFPKDDVLRGKLLAGILILGVIGCAAFLHFRSHFPGWQENGMERSALLFLVASTGLISAFARHYQIPWRSRASWIAIGLFISCLHPGQLFYLLGMLCWLTGFLFRESERIHLSQSELDQLAEFAESLSLRSKGRAA